MAVCTEAAEFGALVLGQDEHPGWRSRFILEICTKMSQAAMGGCASESFHVRKCP